MSTPNPCPQNFSKKTWGNPNPTTTAPFVNHPPLHTPPNLPSAHTLRSPLLHIFSTMAEEQPASVREGASSPPPPAGTAEDRKAAAALSSLDAHDDDSGAAKSGADSEALGQAMEKLNVGGPKKEEQKAVPRRAVRVDPADVNMLVSYRVLF